jgi:hypothetical protein
MRNAICSRKEKEQGDADPREELNRYLDGPLADGIIDVVGYWGVS